MKIINTSAKCHFLMQNNTWTGTVLNITPRPGGTWLSQKYFQQIFQRISNANPSKIYVVFTGQEKKRLNSKYGQNCDFSLSEILAHFPPHTGISAILFPLQLSRHSVGQDKHSWVKKCKDMFYCKGTSMCSTYNWNKQLNQKAQQRKMSYLNVQPGHLEGKSFSSGLWFGIQVFYIDGERIQCVQFGLARFNDGQRFLFRGFHGLLFLWNVTDRNCCRGASRGFVFFCDCSKFHITWFNIGSSSTLCTGALSWVFSTCWLSCVRCGMSTATRSGNIAVTFYIVGTVWLFRHRFTLRLQQICKLVAFSILTSRNETPHASSKQLEKKWDSPCFI